MAIEIDKNRVPQHVAIIMDGNGRWAAERGKPRSYGHQAGVDTVRRITSECTRLGVKFLTLYTLSTENWNRPADEISALMGLVLTSLEDEIFMKNDVRFRVIGDTQRLPLEVQQKLQQVMDNTANNSTMTMVVALSYSARWEITQAAKQIAAEAMQAKGTADETLDTELYQHYWVVEYDPESASVYAVFYSEKRDDYSPTEYNQLRYKKNRLKDGARVGYYGGNSIDGGDTSALVPKITIKNEEKLQVIINSKRPDDNALSFDVKITDTTGKSLTLKYGTDASGKKLIHKQDALHLVDASQLDSYNETGTIRGNILL